MMAGVAEMSGGSDRTRAPRTAAVLRVLATLAPDRRQPVYDVSGHGAAAMAWIGPISSNLESGDPFRRVLHDRSGVLSAEVPTSVGVDGSRGLEALQHYDALTVGLPVLRVGWIWIRGTAVVDSEKRRLLLPLLSRPVTIAGHSASLHLEPLGAWDLWPLVSQPAVAADLEAEATFAGGATSDATATRLQSVQVWIDRVVTASGLPPIDRLVPGTDPTRLRLHDGDGLVAVVGYGVYPEAVVDATHPSETLRTWSTDPAVADSALASLYLGAPTNPADDGPVISPLPLTDRQAEVVRAARTEAVVTVSGPPGTGKSQTAAAIALDAVARGESVLLATQSRAAADVLAELLDRVPGPTPVLFGGGERASKLAAKLADGLEAAVDDGAEQRAEAALVAVDELARAVAADLGVVAAGAEWQRRVLTVGAHAAIAPRLLDTDSSTTVGAGEAEQLVRAARAASDGWFARRRRRRAERGLRTLVGAPPDATLDEISAAVHLGVLRNLAGRAAGRSETDADARWVALEQADLVHRMARGQALAEAVAERPDAASRRAVAALATALRGGRAGRRSHLAQIDVGRLTEALPLWIGTLGEIEAMLPPTAAAFDLVILDEASQIDQIAASAALLRARRAVVIGDPRQLRFVSFLADDAVRQAVAASDCQPLADRLDLRRVSAFDLGASAATVVFLDEHFRSLPHLIGFSARRFYDGRLLVATRHPANEGIDAIDVRRVEGTRSDGVNPAEVDAALVTVHDLLADEERPRQTIGVISPYRAQVDAIRQRVGAEVPIEVLQSGRIRVDTVHGFQGAECDVAVVSFGVSDGAGRGRPFLEDPHLFNVLVTRARRRLVVLASIDDPPPGLLADYLRWADAPMAPAEGGPAADEWTARLAEVLGDAGVAIRTGYPVGRWLVDLVVGADVGAVAVATGVHRDGSAAHIRRHLSLARLGWRQGEAFPTSHDGDPVAAALALAGQDGRPWKR